MSSSLQEMEPASMETQPPPVQRGRDPLSPGVDSSRPPVMNLDNASTTTTTGGDVSTVESLRDPIDPRRTSRDGSELASTPTSKGNDPTLSDKVQGKVQKIAGKISKNTELYEKGEVRESGN